MKVSLVANAEDSAAVVSALEIVNDLRAQAFDRYCSVVTNNSYI